MQPMLDTSNLPRIPEWKKAGEFTDIIYEKAEGIAKITINRPEVRNAFPEFDSFVALKKRNSPVFSGLVAPNHKIPIV